MLFGLVNRFPDRCYTESGLKLLGLDLASLATQGVGAGAQPNAYTGNGIKNSLYRLQIRQRYDIIPLSVP